MLTCPSRALLATLAALSLSLSASLASAQEQPSAPAADQAAPASAKQRSGDTPFGFDVELGGYAQVRYQSIQDDPRVAQFIGLNDGFALSNARLNLSLKRQALSAFFSLEGARDRRQPNNRAQGDVRTLMLDAYFDYSFAPAFTLRLGRFKPAYDANELESTARLLFIDRALESRGVLGVEGLNERGLSLARQTGLQLISKLRFSADMGLKLIVSVTNGNSAESALNDNESLAYTGRAVFKARFNRDVKLRLGGGGYMNEVTTGELPDLISERRVGMTADLQLLLYGLIIQGQWMRQVTSFVEVANEPTRTGEGLHADVGFDLGTFSPALKGLIPSYRFATYDPTKVIDSTDADLQTALGADALTHHTVGFTALLTQSPVDEPLKLQINYTLAREQEARLSKNDRLDLMLQMMF